MTARHPDDRPRPRPRALRTGRTSAFCALAIAAVASACASPVTEEAAPVPEPTPTQNFEPAFVTNLGGSEAGSQEGDLELFPLSDGGYGVIWDRHSGAEHLRLSGDGSLLARNALPTAGAYRDELRVASEAFRLGDDIFLESWSSLQRYDLATGRAKWTLEDVRGIMQRRGGLFRKATPCPGPQSLFAIDPEDGSSRELLTWEVAAEHPTRTLRLLETAQLAGGAEDGTETAGETLVLGFETEADPTSTAEFYEKRYVQTLEAYALPDMRETWTRTLPEAGYSESPERIALVNEVLVILLADTLRGIDLRTGADAWVASLAAYGLDRVASSAVFGVDGANVLLSHRDRDDAVALDARTGKHLGALALGSSESSGGLVGTGGGQFALPLHSGAVQRYAPGLLPVGEAYEPLGRLRYPGRGQLFYDAPRDRLLVHGSGFLYAVDEVTHGR